MLLDAYKLDQTQNWRGVQGAEFLLEHVRRGVLVESILDVPVSPQFRPGFLIVGT
jgi:hypothetical protein